MKEMIKNAFLEAEKVQASFLNDANLTVIEETALAISSAFENGNKVIVCGNGGSCCDAMHFAEEFTGRFRNERHPLPVIALSDASHITCVGNDYGFDHIFARSVEAFGNKGDIFIGISTSGNSMNILNAVLTAGEKGMFTIGLLGKDGGNIKKHCRKTIIVPAQTTDRIQEMHIKILHIIIEMVERMLFPENYIK